MCTLTLPPYCQRLPPHNQLNVHRSTYKYQFHCSENIRVDIALCNDVLAKPLNREKRQDEIYFV